LGLSCCQITKGIHVAVLALNILFSKAAVFPFCIGRFNFEAMPVHSVMADAAEFTFRLQFGIYMMPVIFVHKRP
jgi:hypothetical protein